MESESRRFVRRHDTFFRYRLQLLLMSALEGEKREALVKPMDIRNPFNRSMPTRADTHQVSLSGHGEYFVLHV